MAFTRDELTEYEKKPATVVPDTTDPFTGAAAPTAQPPDPATTPSGETDPSADPDDAGDGVVGSQDDTASASSADTDAAPGGDTGTSQAPAQAPKKGSAAERIQELIGEREDFKAYGEYAQEQIRLRDQRLQELEARLAAAPVAVPAQGEPATPEEPFPTLADPGVDFDADKFQQRVTAWAAKKAERDAKRLAPSTTAAGVETPQQKTQRELQTFLGRAQKFAAEKQDFDEVTKTLPVLAPGAAKVVVLGEDGPAILYYLGKHKADAVRIARLSPEEQLMELGIVRAKLAASTKGAPVIPPTSKDAPAPGAAQTQAKPKAPSSAPTPPSRVTAGGTRTQLDITDPNLSMAEFARLHREARVSQKTQARAARGLR